MRDTASTFRLLPLTNIPGKIRHTVQMPTLGELQELRAPRGKAPIGAATFQSRDARE